ncbi:hypothetical protein CfE428DRAFT_3482 [Chthoniobacter flavus Ellin428]|uniref:Lipocalin-like domain-containing protein n=1 Tax=Chthoniobacter flavus Ellin428 TaxID=497964 RepID=B4D3J4_9BACT|nr:hypothetical protein [Chthoniobacter flavus]EDY18824.1 hypothetical protein CfE428DRAFT_3482 [Chthoniobacter flavus Ellin428]TCO93422.1 hypothetical protein EV701_104126 [Chthoniobacter flavus]
MTVKLLGRLFGFLLIICCFYYSVQAADSDAAPKKFSAAIGGFLTGFWVVEMTAPDTLVYSHSSLPSRDSHSSERSTIKVTDTQWKTFRAHLNAAKVWSWKNEYVNDGVVDGTVWQFTADFGDVRIEAKGRNAYPNQSQFDAMLASVRELLKREEFR